MVEAYRDCPQYAAGTGRGRPAGTTPARGKVPRPGLSQLGFRSGPEGRNIAGLASLAAAVIFFYALSQFSATLSESPVAGPKTSPPTATVPAATATRNAPSPTVAATVSPTAQPAAVRPTAAPTARPAGVPTPAPTSRPAAATPAPSPTRLAPTPTGTRPTPSPAARSHVVQPGETLTRIAASYGISVEDLMKANGLTDRNTLRAGQTLTIP